MTRLEIIVIAGHVAFTRIDISEGPHNYVGNCGDIVEIQVSQLGNAETNQMVKSSWHALCDV